MYVGGEPRRDPYDFQRGPPPPQAPSDRFGGDRYGPPQQRQVCFTFNQREAFLHVVHGGCFCNALKLLLFVDCANVI